MKKLIYSAVMALVLSCFIGCMPRISVDDEPQLDETNSTLLTN